MARRKTPTPKQVADAIDKMIDMIATGVSVRTAAKEVGVISKGTFFGRVKSDQALQERYHDAKNAGIHAFLDANEDDLDDLDTELRKRVTVQTADGPIEAPKYDGKLATALVNATRLRIDHRKWVASKLLPRMYGDKIQVTDAEGDKIPVVHFAVGPQES